MIHVCSLARLEETVARTGANRVVSLVNAATPMVLPKMIDTDNHLFLAMNDIVQPLHGMTAPGRHHVEALIRWVSDWPQDAPMIIHCYAGISRSTAAAYTAVMTLNPERDEVELAETLRALSPSATPNKLIIEHADAILGRGGRMSAAIAAIGRGADAFEGVPFELTIGT